MPAFVHKDLFGGKGTVKVEPHDGALPGGFAAALRCELSKGGSVGRHQQSDSDEVVVGVSGAGRAKVNGVAQKLTPGAMVFLALGQTLELENTSKTKPLGYLILKAAPRTRVGS
jgi:quercetin dioxygenase-like cupin family protein